MVKKEDRAPWIPDPVAKEIIMARIPFTDALTGKSFRAGDAVIEWDKERVAEYLKRGLLLRRIEMIPSEVK